MIVCWVYSLESLDEAILMSIHNIQFHDKIRKKFLQYLFSWAIRRISLGLKIEFELAMVNERSVFDCTKDLTQPYFITKTYLYNFDPLKPHFYIVKLGFTGVYIIFLISAQNIDCGYSLGPPLRGGSNEYPQSMFWAEIWKISEFFIRKIAIFWW